MSKLKELLEQKELSIRQLSRLTKVHKNTLLKYLSVDTPYYDNGRLRVYWKIATGLEIEVEEVLLGSDWHPASDIVRSRMTIAEAVDRKAVWLNTSAMDVHNQIRELLGLNDYATFSAYENYRWMPTIEDAIKIAEFLNCTLDALWGDYLARMENAG